MDMRMTSISAALVAITGAALTGASPAVAGACPPDKVLAAPRTIESRDGIGVSRETLSLVNLKGWRGVGDLFLRTRRLTIAGHGVVPTHNHDDRPSIVFIVKGELIEHSTYCAVPILHRAGEWTSEFGPGHGHWWENPSNAEAVVTSSDVVDQETVDLDRPKADM